MIRRELSSLEKKRSCALFGLVVAAFALPSLRAHAEQPARTLATLIDKAEIEDALSDYYALFHSKGQRDFGSFYTDDGILDANGVVRQGRQAINALYESLGGFEGGRIDILINNLKVTVNGETASADLVWTECSSKSLTALPQILEQGREHDDLVKVDGRWRLKRRVVTNDGGLPKSLLKGYINR